MAAQFPQTTLVRFNRDYPQLMTEGVSRFMSFTEDLPEIFLADGVNILTTTNDTNYSNFHTENCGMEYFVKFVQFVVV